MATATFEIQRIGQIGVQVQDIERAVAFYTDVLGLRLLFRAPPGLAFFDCGGVRLMLSAPESPGADPRIGTSVIYYVVPDIHAAYETLGGRGAWFERPPHLIARMPDHELWMTFLKDSEGNMVGLMSERPLGA